MPAASASVNWSVISVSAMGGSPFNEASCHIVPASSGASPSITTSSSPCRRASPSAPPVSPPSTSGRSASPPETAHAARSGKNNITNNVNSNQFISSLSHDSTGINTLYQSEVCITPVTHRDAELFRQIGCYCPRSSSVDQVVGLLTSRRGQWLTIESWLASPS